MGLGREDVKKTRKDTYLHTWICAAWICCIAAVAPATAPAWVYVGAGTAGTIDCLIAPLNTGEIICCHTIKVRTAWHHIFTLSISLCLSLILSLSFSQTCTHTVRAPSIKAICLMVDNTDLCVNNDRWRTCVCRWWQHFFWWEITKMTDFPLIEMTRTSVTQSPRD